MLRILLHAIGRFFITVIFGVPRTRRIEDEPCIVVANHNSHMDIMVLFRVFRLRRVNRVMVVAAKDYFGRGFRGWGARALFRLILLERRVSGSADPLEPIRAALRDKCSVILFPEGTRGRPGELQHFKGGVGKLAIDFPDVPVYPVVIQGAEKALPRGGRLLVPFDMRLSVLEPVYGRDYIADGPAGRKNLTAHLEELMRAAVD
jgi:1-acyl-sn-glycerol-3-phosphate acyltransferase